MSKKKEPVAGKDPIAVELGRRGGLANAKKHAGKPTGFAVLSVEERSALAKKAIATRWAKAKKAAKKKGAPK